MPIPVTCPCGRFVRADDGLAGRKVKCPQCGGVLLVPMPEDAPAEEEFPLLPLDDPEEEPRPDRQESPPEPEEMVQAAPHPSRPPARNEDDDQDDEDDDERSLREEVRRREERRAEREEEREEDRRKRRRRAGRRRAERESEPDGGAFGPGWFGNVNAGVAGGVVMILVGGFLFLIGLKGGCLFFFPIVLVIIGIGAIFKGMLDR